MRLERIAISAAFVAVTIGSLWVIFEGTSEGPRSSHSLAFAPSSQTEDSVPILDSDGDGIPDVAENSNSSTALSAIDTDLDTIPDGWEVHFGLDPNALRDGTEDWDQDNLTNAAEYAYCRCLETLTASFSDEAPSSGLNPNRADTDGGGLRDGFELAHGFDPLDSFDDATDPDRDGLSSIEEEIEGTDPGRWDTDGDGLGDGQEVRDLRTSPRIADTDRDGIRDDFEMQYGLDPLDATDAYGDIDRDGLENLQEYKRGSDPREADTDGDQIPDGWEIVVGLVPTASFDAGTDGDQDGLTALEEFRVRDSPLGRSTDPRVADTDGDGLDDGVEVKGRNPYKAPTNPFAADTDGDTLRDADEVREHGTNPARKDTDNDGLADPVELNEYRSNPLQADTDGDAWDDGPEATAWKDLASLAAKHYAGPADVPAWLLKRHTGKAFDLLLKEFQPLGDLDADGIPNLLDDDSDADRISDGREAGILGTDPGNPDTDGDGMPDEWEVRFRLDPLSALDREDDLDGDGLAVYAGVAYVSPISRRPPQDLQSTLPALKRFTNFMEFENGTSPIAIDSDCDGVPDGWEAFMAGPPTVSGLRRPNPLAFDSHDDWDEDAYDVDQDNAISAEERLTVFEEWWFFLDARSQDTDADGMRDGEQVWVNTRADEADRRPALVGLPENGRQEREKLTESCSFVVSSTGNEAMHAVSALSPFTIIAAATLNWAHRRWRP